MSIARRLALVCATILTLTVTACTPAQQAAWKAMSDQERENYVAHIEGRPPYEVDSMGEARSGDCYQALDRHWPAASRSWARSIVARESGGDPRAQNPRSSAAGCLQLLALHSGRFNKLGYSWERDRYNADVNVLVALDLYREAGTSPWRL